MAAPKASPRPKPVLENFYTVGWAAVRLNLKTKEEHEAGSTKGERWLRDGVNRDHNPFPCHRMSGQLQFSDSDLAEIAAMNRNAPDKRTGRSRRKRKPAAPRLAAVGT
ncbi:hypothetical protein ACWELB_20775 [Streptomyces asiaticus]